MNDRLLGALTRIAAREGHSRQCYTTHVGDLNARVRVCMCDRDERIPRAIADVIDRAIWESRPEEALVEAVERLADTPQEEK